MCRVDVGSKPVRTTEVGVYREDVARVVAGPCIAWELTKRHDLDGVHTQLCEFWKADHCGVECPRWRLGWVRTERWDVQFVQNSFIPCRSCVSCSFIDNGRISHDSIHAA